MNSFTWWCIRQRADEAAFDLHRPFSLENGEGFIFPALDMAMFTIVLEALYPVIP